jgi:hypothetical protein
LKAIVTVVEKLTSEAHIEIPDRLSEDAIRQHIVDQYNNGEMQFDMNIFQVDFESISAHLGSKPHMIWQEGNTSENYQNYFCKLGKFLLTLTTDVEKNVTRTEAYFGYPKQLIYQSEKEVSKEAAAVELQNLLTGLAVELQVLSHVGFKN